VWQCGKPTPCIDGKAGGGRVTPSFAWPASGVHSNGFAGAPHSRRARHHGRQHLQRQLTEPVIEALLSQPSLYGRLCQIPEGGGIPSPRRWPHITGERRAGNCPVACRRGVHGPHRSSCSGSVPPSFHWLQEQGEVPEGGPLEHLQPRCRHWPGWCSEGQAGRHRYQRGPGVALAPGRRLLAARAEAARCRPAEPTGSASGDSAKSDDGVV